jgi:hypothetical protein
MDGGEVDQFSHDGSTERIVPHSLYITKNWTFQEVESVLKTGQLRDFECNRDFATVAEGFGASYEPVQDLWRRSSVSGPIANWRDYNCRCPRGNKRVGTF